MKRTTLYIVLNSLAAITLAFFTVDMIHQTRHAGDSGTEGWVIFSPIGTLTGLLPLILLLGIFIVDALWVLFCIIWLVKRTLHIKDKDNTLYFP